MLLTIDVETFWAADYSLTKMSEVDYIRDPRFEVLMCAAKVDNQPTEILEGRGIKRYLDRVDWSRTTALAHNVRFDGAILAWHYHHVPAFYLDTLSMSRATTHWTIGRSSLAKVADYLGLPAKGDEVIRAKGKRRADFTDYEWELYKRYCIRDTDLCHAIFQKMRPLFRASELNLIDMIARMFITPQVRLNAQVLEENLDRVLAAKAAALAKVASVPRETFSSQPKFAALLEEHGVEVPTKISPTTGQEIPALAKGDWAFKELCADDSLPPFVQLLLAARVSEKSTLEETRSRNMLALSKRRWAHGSGWAPIPLKYSGARCVPGDTEVFTRHGWVALQDWDGGDIAQVHPDQRVEFLPATRFVGEPTFEWITVDAPYLKCRFTPGHVMPYLCHGSFAWATMQAINLLDRGSTIVPIGGSLVGSGSITPEQMRVLVMVQADGHWQTKAPGRSPELRIKVMKPRKIERARKLLREAGIVFREGVYASQSDYVSFRISGVDWPEWLTIERKLYGDWLLDSTPEARTAFIDELVHWDGTIQNNQLEYSTVDQVNADWVVTMAHLTGFSARISTKPPTGKGRQLLYRVRLRRRASAYVFDKHIETENPPYLTPFCATTQTGFFLARRQGRIFVTGNTHRLSGDGGANWQNLPRGSLLRTAVEAPAGWRVVHRDSSQIEARMTAWMAKCDTLIEAFAEGRDVYSEFAAIIYDRPITREDTLERFVGKTAILGLGYGCGYVKFRKMLFIGNGGISLKVDDETAEVIVANYRATYPEIPALWAYVSFLLKEVVKLSRRVIYKRPPYGVDYSHIPVELDYDSLILPNGLKLSYPELRQDSDLQLLYTDPNYTQPRHMYGAKGVENISQALARIIVTDIAVRVRVRTGYTPFLSTHDSLDYCVPAADAEAIDKELEKQFAFVPAWGAGLPLASEGGWGKNLTLAEKKDNQ